MAESNFYSSIAKLAANAERDGKFKEAANLWINCSFAALSAVNRQYATHRSEFCLKQTEVVNIADFIEEEVNHG